MPPEMRAAEMRLHLLFAMSAALVVSGQAFAGTSSTLHIGAGANTPCAEGSCPIFVGGPFNGEVNNINGGVLDIFQQSNGAGSLNPVLLILGVPNGPLVNPGSFISGATIYAPYSGTSDSNVPTGPVTWSYGSAAFHLAGFDGAMTSGDVYGFLGLSGNHSNSFTNWSGADALMNIPVTGFNIYTFQLDSPVPFGANDLINISLGDVPEGSFAVSYGAAGAGQRYDTPFTQAGLRDTPPTPIPEPDTLTLLGAGLATLTGAAFWRKAAGARS